MPRRSGSFGRVLRRVTLVLVIAFAVLAWEMPGISQVDLLHRTEPASACVHHPAPAVSVLSGTPDELAASVARALLACARAVVVANAGSQAAVATAVTAAEHAHAPVFLASPPGIAAFSGGPAVIRRAQLTASVSTATAREVSDLRPSSVLAVGLTAGALSAARCRGCR